MGPRKHNYIAVLDIGSFKISCFIIRIPIDIASIPEDQRISSILLLAQQNYHPQALLLAQLPICQPLKMLLIMSLKMLKLMQVKLLTKYGLIARLEVQK